MFRLPALIFRLALPALFLALATTTLSAGECPRPLDERRAELDALLRQPTLAEPLPASAKHEPALAGVVQTEQGLRLPLAKGSALILPHEWGSCRPGDNCEPAERFEALDHLDLGYWLVAGLMAGNEGALLRLVNDRTGVSTLIGGRPLPSPSGKRAAVVAGYSPYVWSGTEIWAMAEPEPKAEWEQDAPPSADYAFRAWIDDDTVLLAVRGLDVDQPGAMAAVLACGGNSWHLIHGTEASWLDRRRSPSGHRVAVMGPGIVAVLQDGEQVFTFQADAKAFLGWQDEDTALFAKDGGELTLRYNGWAWGKD